MPPVIHDNPNATLFIDVYSLKGSYADVLPFCLNIQVSDHTRSDGAEPLGPVAADVCRPFHTAVNTKKESQDNGA